MLGSELQKRKFEFKCKKAISYRAGGHADNVSSVTTPASRDLPAISPKSLDDSLFGEAACVLLTKYGGLHA